MLKKERGINMISNIVEGLEAVKFTASEIRIEEFTTDQYGQECIDLITLLRKEGRICDTLIGFR